MRRRLLAMLLAVSLFFSACTGCAPKGLQLRSPSISERSYYAVKTGTLNGGQCTATPVKTHILLTASHCIHEGSPSMLYRHGEEIPLDLLSVDLNLDLALLRSPQALPPLDIGEQPYAGDTVFAVGYGENAPIPYYFGAVFLGVVTVPTGVRLALINHHVMPGMSGGPLLNAAGDVIGVLIMTGKDIGIATPYDEMKQFLDSNLQHLLKN